MPIEIVSNNFNAFLMMTSMSIHLPSGNNISTKWSQPVLWVQFPCFAHLALNDIAYCPALTSLSFQCDINYAWQYCDKKHSTIDDCLLVLRNWKGIFILPNIVVKLETSTALVTYCLKGGLCTVWRDEPGL